MIIEVSEAIQVQLDDGGLNWTVLEKKERTDKDGNKKEATWEPAGYFGSPHQALQKALRLLTFDRRLERITVVALVKRLEVSEAKILDAIAKIDRVSYEALVAPREEHARKLQEKSGHVKNRDMKAAEKAMTTRPMVSRPARKGRGR